MPVYFWVSNCPCVLEFEMALSYLTSTLIKTSVSECRRMFSKKVASQRHMYKDWARKNRSLEEHQLEFTCIKQKSCSRANLICRFCGCGEKTQDRFLTLLRKNLHSESLRITKWGTVPWKLDGTNTGKHSRVVQWKFCLPKPEAKVQIFYLEGESSVLQTKPKGNKPVENSWSEKRRREGKGFFCSASKTWWRSKCRQRRRLSIYNTIWG